MALHHLHPHRCSTATPARLWSVGSDGRSHAAIADVARLLHVDAAHCERAMSLWSATIGVPVDDLLRCVVDRGDRDPGPPRWVVELTRAAPESR